MTMADSMRRRRHAPGREQIHEDAEEQRESHGLTHGDQRQVGTGVLEDHGLVHHGELEVGGRVVHRAADRSRRR